MQRKSESQREGGARVELKALKMEKTTTDDEDKWVFMKLGSSSAQLI